MSADEKLVGTPPKTAADDPHFASLSEEKKKEFAREVDELNRCFKGKWFLPVLEDLSAFEACNPNFESDMKKAVGDDAPEFSFNSVLKGANAIGKTPFGTPLEKFGADAPGFMLGAKWALVSAWASQPAQWKSFSAAQVAEIEAVAGKGYVEKQIVNTSEWARRLPLLNNIKARAFELAARQQRMEHSAFLRGFADGLNYAEAIAELQKPIDDSKVRNGTATEEEKRHIKRQQDERNHQIVLTFAALHGPEIEQNKTKWGWPGILDRVAQMTNYQVEIADETVKKILQREGLTEVGVRGCPPET